jgi:hypothetical protein
MVQYFKQGITVEAQSPSEEAEYVRLGFVKSSELPVPEEVPAEDLPADETPVKKGKKSDQSADLSATAKDGE